MRYSVCRVIWASRGYTYKTVSVALQEKFPGREGLAASSLQRYVQLGDEAPPDVVEAIRTLPIQADSDAEGAKVVELGLDALERGPIVDPDALAASLRTKLPGLDPQIIAAAVTARLCGSDELAKKIASEVIARQPDAFEIAWKAAAEALAQEPKPPSADDVAAKVVAALAQQPKKIARYVARRLQRLKAKPRDPLRDQELGDEIAQKLLEKTPPPEAIAQAVAVHLPKVDESKLAAIVVRRLLPLFGGGAAVLVATVGVFLHYQYDPYQPSPDGHVTIGNDGELRPPLVLGQHRLPLWDWQDRPPCSEVAREIDGGCWLPLEYRPPCPKESWEKDGKCWVPAGGRDRKRPPQAGDGAESSPPAQNPR